MKKTFFVIVLILMITLIGCRSDDGPNIIRKESPKESLSQLEEKRVALYVSALRAAYNEGHGGTGFIAIDMKKMKNLSTRGEALVLEKMSGLVESVYAFEDIFDDSNKFERDKNGDIVRIMNGTLLIAEIEEFNDTEAIVSGETWFGNYEGRIPKYEAKYNGKQWQLRLISVVVDLGK